MGIGQRIRFAFRAFFTLLFKGTLAPDIAAVASNTDVAVPSTVASPTRVQEVTTTGSPKASKASGTIAASMLTVAESSADGAVQLLSLLQRDARLLDFLMEDLSSYPDAQVGAAVRDVHANARRTLSQYLEVEPILDGIEDDVVTLATVDPIEVKVVGRTPGTPPIRGLLRHRGWRSARVSLPPLPASSARQIVAPAEVEVP